MALRQPRSSEAADIEAVPWSQLGPRFMQAWEQGDHAALIGPTKTGKTTLAVSLLEMRLKLANKAHVLMLANKRRDPVTQELMRKGWPRITEWPPHYEHRQRRKVILWPHYGKASQSAATNRKIFLDALDEVVEEGSWFVFIDDAAYFIESLKLRTSLDEMWNAARSSRVTIIGAAQSASWIPRSMTTNQSWVFAFRSRDQDVRKRVAEVAGDRRYYMEIMDQLGPHDFILVQTTTGEAYVSNTRT